MKIVQRLLRHRLAKGAVAGTKAVQILWGRQGFLRSAFAQRSIDAANRFPGPRLARVKMLS
jgi:hypothetical protein